MNGIFFITKLITIDIDILLLDYHRVTAIPWLKKSPYKLKKSYVLFRFSLQTRCCGRANRLETETFFLRRQLPKTEREMAKGFFFFFYSGAAELDEIADAGPSVGGTADPGAQLLAQPLVRHADHLDDHQVPPGQQSAPSVIDSAESQPERN